MILQSRLLVCVVTEKNVDVQQQTNNNKRDVAIIMLFYCVLRIPLMIMENVKYMTCLRI